MCSLFQGSSVHPAFFRCSGEGVLSIVRHSSVDPRFAQSNERVRVTRYALALLRARKNPSFVKWAQTRSLVKQVHVTRARVLYSRARNLASARTRTRTLHSRWVHSASARSLRFTLTRSQSCDCTTRASGNEQVLASYSVMSVQGLLRRTILQSYIQRSSGLGPPGLHWCRVLHIHIHTCTHTHRNLSTVGEVTLHLKYHNITINFHIVCILMILFHVPSLNGLHGSLQIMLRTCSQWASNRYWSSS